MRYYDIALQSPSGGVVKRWSSYPGGSFDPAALNVLFDIPVAPYATPIGMQTITLEGVQLSDLSETQQFAGMNLAIKAGMLGGLPLENPKQAGLITEGNIFQSFGNWIGTDMTLDFVLLPSIFTHSNKGNLTLHWAPGMTLATALQNTLTGRIKVPGGQALPVSINIANYTNTFDSSHASTTLEGLAAYVHNATKNATMGPVHITVQRGTVFIFDGSWKPSPVQIAFNDLVGQPTWINVETIQVKTVLRADLQIGSIIQMPQGYVNAPGAVITTQSALPSSIKYKSAFTRRFMVIKLRQIGNFRSSDSGEWATVFNCIESGSG